jgi:eukaryotic-like serine/threonine-protein kinase
MNKLLLEKHEVPMSFKLAPGEIPLSGYTIRHGLGLGGFGEVYLAVSDSGKEVALKRIHRNLDIEMRGANQCLNLRHPNLVSLFDIRQEDEQQGWIVMEFVEGDTLNEILERSPKGLPVDDVRRWFGQIGAAVDYLHRHGIVHRDLKPANIFVQNGFVKIGDYGLSKFLSSSRRAGHTQSVGTFHYMAPEIGRGEYGREVDVYALGIILYEMLTGQVPFDGESSQEIIMKHLTSDPDLSRLPEPFRHVVGLALAKDPRDRFATVSDMLSELGIRIDSSGMATVESLPNQTREAIPAANDNELTLPTRYYREPIANAVAAMLGNFQKSVEAVPFGTTIFVGVILLVIYAMLANGFFVTRSLLLGGGCYAVYYVFWYSTVGYRLPKPSKTTKLEVSGVPEPPAVGSAPLHQSMAVKAIPASAPIARPWDKKPKPAGLRYRAFPFHEWQAEQRVRLADAPWSERWSEWSKSNLRAAGCLTVLGVLGYLITLATNPIWSQSADFLAVGVWTACMTCFTSWTILFFSKTWERQPEDSLLYRFVLLGSGLALGFVGWGLSEFLLVPWDSISLASELDANRRTIFGDFPKHRLWPGFYDDRMPQWPAFVGYFGLLMGGIRWWRQADILRKSRFSIFGSIWTVVVATIVHAIIYFPSPWCLFVAGGTSVLVQLSTRTVNSKDRPRYVIARS